MKVAMMKPKRKAMVAQARVVAAEAERWSFYISLYQ